VTICLDFAQESEVVVALSRDLSYFYKS